MLAEQVLGIDTEQKNWETRLANAQSFVNQYNSILSQLNSGVGGTSSSSAGGGSSTSGGYHFDYSKGTSGWTEQELLESDPNYYKNNAVSKAIQAGVGIATGVALGGASKLISSKKHAVGTLSAPGGLSLVGERGPELRVLNSGDGIIPADTTRNLWDWGAYNPKDFMGSMRSDNIFHIGNIALPNVTDAKSFVNSLKQLAYQRAYKRA